MRHAAQFATAWLLTLFFSAAPAAAQCAMCAKSVASGGGRVIDVIKLGIYVLLIPTILIFGALALMVYRRRQRTAPGDSEDGFAASTLPETPGTSR